MLIPDVRWHNPWSKGTAISTILVQLIDGEWKSLAFFSRKLSHVELKFSAFSYELLAIYLSTKHFRYFLEGRQFAIYTDHLPLTTAITSATDRSPQQARHLSYVTEFMTNLWHLPWKTYLVVDALSRSCTVLNTVLAISYLLQGHGFMSTHWYWLPQPQVKK